MPRTTRSRSVTTPRSTPSSMTGSMPMLASRIFSAASSIVAVDSMITTSSTITSFTWFLSAFFRAVFRAMGLLLLRSSRRRDAACERGATGSAKRRLKLLHRSAPEGLAGRRGGRRLLGNAGDRHGAVVLLAAVVVGRRLRCAGALALPAARPQASAVDVEIHVDHPLADRGAGD